MRDGTHIVYVRPEAAETGLRELPGRFDAVESPATVTDLLRDHDPTVLVCEYSLDGRETGLDVLSRVRKNHPEVPVFLCTAEPDGEVASAATRLGVTEYVPHEGGTTTLADRVRPYLDDDESTPVADGNPGTQAAGGMPGDPTAETVGTSPRERDLERVNRRLDLALDSVDAGVFVWHVETGEVRWDEWTSDLFGLEPRRRTTDCEAVLERVHPDDRDRVLAAADRARDGTGDFEVEYRVELPDGGQRWLATHAERARDRPDDGDRFIGVVRDVTERRRMADQLRESRTALQRLYEITSRKDLSFEAKLDALLSLGCDRLGLDLGYLTSVDDDRIEVVQAVGDGSLAGHETDLSNTYCRRTVESEALVDIRDSTTGEWAGSTPTAEYGLSCYLGGRVEVDGELYGTLCFADERPRDRTFSEAETTFVELVVAWLSFELERRERERDLRDARERAENILSRIDDGFFAVDDDWSFTYFNQQAEEILGLSAAEVIGENVWDCFPEAVEHAFYDEYHEAMETQEPTSFEEYLPALNMWFSVSAYPSPDGLSVYFEDVTDRKRRQQDLERYETIMETIDDGVYALDDEGRFTFANEALAELTGHDVSDLLGRHVSVIKSEQTVKLGEEVLGRMLSDGIQQTTFEFDLEHADGRRIPFEDRMTLLPFEDGEFTGTAGVFRDISKHKRRETVLTSLMETTRELMRAPSKAAVANIVVDATADVLGFDLNTVRLYDAERGTLDPVATTETTSTVMGERPAYEVGEGGPGTVFQRGERAFFSDLDLPDERAPAESSLYLPLGDHGVLSIGSTAADAFDEIDEQVAGILATNARVALDRAEREQELTRYETIMETVQHMVYVLDADGRFTMVTNPFADRLGADREELLGRRADEFVAGDAPSRFASAITELSANPELSSRTIETEIRSDDGDRFPAAVEVSLFPGERFTGTVGVVQELTELEQTRERLRDERDRFSYLFDNIPDAAVDTQLVDGTPVVQSTNPAFADVFGYEDEEILGEPIADYVQPDHGDAGVERFGDGVAAGEIEEAEIHRQTADGDRHFLFRGIPYRIGGDTTRAFGIYTDITDQKHRQRQLEVLNRVLRHNIRNDLTVVLGHADQLAYELEDPDHLALVDTLASKAEDIVSTSEKVRDVERTIGRSVEGNSVNLAATVEPVVEECRADYPAAEFAVDVPDHLRVRADDQLRTAVRNLVENAVEHNDSDTPSVRVAATTDDADSVEVRVADDGPGIPENERAVVGGDEPITQLNHASGLGLWLVRWIVDAAGGTLSFGERRDGGTVVSLTLQRADSRS